MKVCRTEKIISHNKDLKEICFNSKNLYNAAQYLCRQFYFENKENKDILKVFLFYNQLYKLLKDTPEYKALPAAAAQQTLKKVDRTWKSYRKAIQSYWKDKSKFIGEPKIPGYLKKTGLYVVEYPGQGLSIKEGFIRLPRTDIKIQTSDKIVKGNVCCLRVVPYCDLFKIEIVYEREIEDLKLDSTRILGIDIGVNNLAAVTSNQNDIPTFLINGRPLKSFNQYYNKNLAKKKSILKQVNKQNYSKECHRLTYKRNQKIEDYLHKASHWVISICKELDIGTIIIGKNDGWKQGSKLGKKNNQNFVQLPFAKFIHMIQYKAEEIGIKIILTEESYTSKIDHFVLEEMKYQNSYLGKRIKRGLFQSSNGKILNSDINGS